MTKFSFPIVLGMLLIISSCKDVNTKEYDPIKLGDSTLIVTETNPEFLKNDVEDIDPKSIKNRDTIINVAPVDTNKSSTVVAVDTSIKTKPAATNANDFIIDIGNNTSIVFANFKIKSYRNQQPSINNSLTYQRTNGNLENVKIAVVGGKLTSVKQKYNSHVVAKFKDATFPVSSLGDFSTGYQNVKVNGNNFVAENLSNPSFKKVSKQNIISALNKEIKNKKYSKKEIGNLNKEINKVQSVNKDPLSVVVKYVVWQITGVDSKGKSFTKEIRIDK